MLMQDAEALEEGHVGLVIHSVCHFAEGREVCKSNGWCDSVVALQGNRDQGAEFTDGHSDALVVSI